MLGKPREDSFVPRHYDVLAGLDVDKGSVSVTFVDHREMIRSMRIPSRADHLINYVRKRFPGQKVAFVYEAGPTGYGWYDQLTAASYPCLVVAPSMVPTAPGQRVKTNRLDSQKLAVALRGGQLKSIYVPSLAYRHLRHLTQLRDIYVRQIAGFKCRIRALLLFEGLPFPAALPGAQWSARVLAELHALPCAEAVRFKLDHLLDSLLFAKTQALATQREIRRFCRSDPELARQVGYLRSIPGIGWIVAGHLLARIGDWRHLRHVRQLAGFLGLVAREHSTGEQIQRGAITRVGDGRLRNKLIQSAWAAAQRDPELREFYWRIYHRHPRQEAARKAIVAVARKLTTRIYAVLKEQRPYQVRPTGGPDLITGADSLAPGTTRRSAEPGEVSPAGSTCETEIPGR